MYFINNYIAISPCIPHFSELFSVSNLQEGLNLIAQEAFLHLHLLQELAPGSE